MFLSANTTRCNICDHTSKLGLSCLPCFDCMTSQLIARKMLHTVFALCSSAVIGLQQALKMTRRPKVIAGSVLLDCGQPADVLVFELHKFLPLALPARDPCSPARAITPSLWHKFLPL